MQGKRRRNQRGNSYPKIKVTVQNNLKTNLKRIVSKSGQANPLQMFRCKYLYRASRKQLLEISLSLKGSKIFSKETNVEKEHTQLFTTLIMTSRADFIQLKQQNLNRLVSVQSKDRHL